MLILGIESSCDETAAAVVQDGVTILSNVVASQIPFHQKYGGVVPEIASRKHVESILPVVHEAMTSAAVGWSDLAGIAVTTHPGLIGSLVVGVAAAKALIIGTDLPLIEINHLEAHMYANCLMGLEYTAPHVGLLVSGGHTLLCHYRGPNDYTIIGRTVDDAVGEAFDKVAKLMSIGYPGGPAIEKLARAGDPLRYHLPLPMKDSGDLNFSFSGLKTAVRTYCVGAERINQADLAASFQKAAVDILVLKTRKAVTVLQAPAVTLSGGVAANTLLRTRLEAMADDLKLPFWAPPVSLCTDNAAMTAGLGYQKLIRGQLAALDLNAHA